MTLDEFWRIPEDGLRHELIGGEHIVTPSPANKHQRVSRNLLVALHNFMTASPIGEVLPAPADVVLSDEDVVVPDLLVVLADQRHIMSDLRTTGAPAILVEILSPSNRKTDEGIKRDLYERRGVREYWIVDPKRAVITVYRRDANREFARAPKLRQSSGDTLSSPLLPGFLVSLKTIFE